MSDQDWTIPISESTDDASTSASEYHYHIISSGDIIGQKYQIIEELGSGGFATTYLAINTLAGDNNKCVIKQLQPRFNSPSIWENAKLRLETEGLVLQKLGEHSQIPQLLDYFEENKQFYLVLEFIAGQDFSQEVQEKILSEIEAIQFLQEVLVILDFVHQQNVIHRDIKPSNLIRNNKDQKITLIDFGAVKEIGTTILPSSFGTNQYTLYTQIIGTPGYMPPEQNSGKPVFSSDLYALGKTVIYALTGYSPVECEQMEIDEGIPWQDNLDISQGLINFISKMISPKISERFTSATQAIRELKPLLIVGKVLQERYSIVKHISSCGNIDHYVVQDLHAHKYSLYFATKIAPVNSKDFSQSQREKDIQDFTKKISKANKNSQILSIIDFLIAENYYYLIQEYCSGNTLKELIDKNNLFSEADTLKLIKKIAIELNICHQQQIIHGNINPSSLIYCQDTEKVFLQDFNIFGEIANEFSAPTMKTDYLNDIYSLGMTAIYVLTGLKPQDLQSHSHTGQIFWEKHTKVSSNVITLINKMICLDKKQCYQSTDQVIRDVRKIRSSVKFPLWYLYILSIPLLLIGILFMVAQWSQRTAILEFYKADIMLEEQQYASAISYYDSGLDKIFKTRKQVKNYQQVWLKQATAFSRLEKYQAALDTCNEALKYYQSYQLWNCQGLALDSLGRYQEAIAAYDQAIAIESEYLWLWNNRGEVHAKLGQVEQAIADFQKAISLNQHQSFVPWNNLGKLYYQQQQHQEAMSTYQQAIAIKDDYVPALIGLGNCYKALKQYSSALATYNKVIRIDDHAYEAWLGKGLSEESLGEYVAAAQTYQQALNIREAKEDGVVVEQALQRVLGKLRIDK